MGALDSLRPGESQNKADRRKQSTLSCTADSDVIEKVNKIVYATKRRKPDVVLLLIEAGLEAWDQKFSREVPGTGPLPSPPPEASSPVVSPIQDPDQFDKLDPPVEQGQRFDGVTGAGFFPLGEHG